MLVREPSWHDDIAVGMSLSLDVVVALAEELARSITTEVGSEGVTVWSARHGALCAQGARFLGCTSLRVKASSSQWGDGWLVRHVGLDPGFGLGLARRGGG